LNSLAEALALEPAGLVFAAVVILMAGLARGFSGIGLSAIVVGGLTVIISPVEAVVIAILCEIVASIGQARGIYREIDWKLLGLLLAGAALGSPFGVYLLTVLDPAASRIAIALIIALASVAMLAGMRITFTLTAARTGLTGLISGAVNGLTALGGLPVALAMAASNTSGATLRATIIAYLFVLDVYATGLLARQSLIDQTALMRVGAALPLLAIGIAVGTLGFRRVSAERFRKVLYGFLIGLAILVLARTLLGD
jgi:uncharacterized membrane protein YfcA